MCYGMGSSITLEDTLASAYEFNPDLKSQREATKAQDEQFMQAFGGWLPNVQVTTNDKHRKVPKQSAQKGRDANLTITQNLFNGGTDWASVKQSLEIIETSRLDLLNKEQDVLYNTSKAYVEVMRRYELYKKAKEEESDAKILHASISRKFELGEATKTDLAISKANMAESTSNKVSAYGDFYAAKANLTQLTGIEVFHKFSKPNKLPMPISLNQLNALALKQNPILQQATSGVEIADYKKSAQRGQLLPNVELDYIVDDRSKDFTPRTSVSSKTLILSVKAPIFQQGKNWSSYRQSKRLAQKAQYDLSNIRNRVEATSTALWGQFEATKSLVESKKEAYEARKIAYDGTKKEQEVGHKSVDDVVTARKYLFQDYAEFLEAQALYYDYMYQIKKHTADCTAKSLKLNVTIYDPVKNFNAIKWQLIGAYNPD